MSQRIHVFVLDEISLPSFLFRKWRGHEIAILAIRPIFPQLERRFENIVHRAVGSRKVRWAIDYAPELSADWKWDRNLYFQNVYSRYEAWQDAYFSLPSPGGETNDFKYAFNHVTANYVYDKAIEIYLLAAMERNHPDHMIVAAGMTRDTIDMFTAFFGRQPTRATSRSGVIDCFLNIAIGLLIFCMIALHMTRRTRLRVRSQPVFCIIDRLGNAQEELLVGALGDGGTVASLVRGGGAVSGPSARWGDGKFSLSGLVVGLGETIMCLCSLGRNYWHLSSRHFFMTAAMARKAILWRGLFNIYRPAHFFGRDEYNSDHVLRGRELRRIGGVSHGLSGAIYSAYTDAAPNSRYVSYDHLYVAGENVVISDRWRKGMKLHSIGSWGFPDCRFDGNYPPGDDILISVRIAFDNEDMINITHRVADRYPDTTVHLQMKPVTFVSAEEMQVVIRKYIGTRSNIRVAEEPVYELMEKARYHFTDISTLVAESVHRGTYCFVADVIGHKTCCYRSFPDMCVTTADEAVKRLEKLETGSWKYPRSDYLARLGIQQHTKPFALIRKQVGLPPT